MKGNWLFRYLAETPEPPEEAVVVMDRPKAGPYSCPRTDNQLQCAQIPRQERCEDCLLRTR